MLEKIKNSDWWIDKCLNDLYFLNRVILCTLEDPTPGYKDLYKPTHKRICDFVQKYAKPGHKVLILCPRGWIKSYMITTGWMIQNLLNNLVKGKREHWLLTNATLSNAQQFLKRIKYNLQYNEFLRSLFADFIPKNPETEAERWTMDEIEIKGTSIEVGSVDKNLVSRHYHGIIHDDPVNKDNSNTQEQIIKVIDWWKLAQSLLESDGWEVLLGTRWCFNDLYGHIIDNFLKIPSDVSEEQRRQPVVEWHNGRYHYLRYLCWEDPVNEKGSTYPILFPEEKLREIKETQVEHFSGQYLNDPISLSDAPFQKIWLVPWKKEEIPAKTITFQLIDPSGKDTKASDFVGNVVIEAGSDKIIYIKYAKRRRLTDLKAVEWMIDTAVLHQAQMIGVEEFKFQTYKDLAEFLIPQLVRQGRYKDALAEYAYRIPNRMVMLRHHNRPKELRIKNLTGWFEHGKIKIAPIDMQDLIEELVKFPKFFYDDIIDALAYALDIVHFPREDEPVKYFTVPEEDKLTPEEREELEWKNIREMAYVNRCPFDDDDEDFSI